MIAKYTSLLFLINCSCQQWPTPPKYGVDSDGEIRVVDRWDGEEVEDPMAGEGSPDDTEV